MFELNFDSLEWYVWALIGLFISSFFIQLFYYLYFYTAVLGLKKKIIKSELPYLDNYPSVSIVICARNESENLSNFLPSILSQKYPNYEVIVVNDGSSDETKTVLSQLQQIYPHLYHTYVPHDAQVMSAKKLALTVGIKAAKNDLLLFTDADCKPVSDYWVRNMVRNFTPSTDIVLGYGAYEKKKGFLSHLISYDTFFIALQYMGFALKGNAYMGVGRNMAYRKEVFFGMKGFASILHLQSGDDDLFVNKAANRSNVRVEINPDSVTESSIKESFKDWFVQKERHLSTASYYKGSSKFIIGLEVLTRGLFYASLAVLAYFVDPYVYSCVFGLFLFRYIIQLLVINITAKHFRERYFVCSVLLLDILLPLITLNAMLGNKLRRKKLYKWK